MRLVIVSLTLVGLSACAENLHPTEPAAPVATVDGGPITVEDLLPHMRSDDDSSRSLHRKALKDAIRVRLFANAARPRIDEVPEGPKQEVDAYLVRQFIEDAMANAQLSFQSVTRAMARRYYLRNNRERVMTSARLLVLEVGDRETARSLKLSVTRGMDFLAAANSSRLEDPYRSGRALRHRIDEHGHGVPEDVAQRVREMREGQTAIVEDENRVWAVFVERINRKPKPWTPSYAARIRNFILHRETSRLLRGLEKELRAAAEIVVDRLVLSAVAAP
ncbi:MAG: hypothetical protein ACRDJ2_15680 [Actinomycetota bacterium]